MPRDLSGLPASSGLESEVLLTTASGTVDLGASTKRIGRGYFDNIDTEMVEAGVINALVINSKTIGSVDDRVGLGCFDNTDINSIKAGTIDTGSMRLGTVPLDGASIGTATSRIGIGYFDDLDVSGKIDVSGAVFGKTIGVQQTPVETGYFNTVYTDELVCGGLNVALVNNLRPTGGKYSKNSGIQTLAVAGVPTELLVGGALGSQNFILQNGDQYRLTMSGTIYTEEKKNELEFKFTFGDVEFHRTGAINLFRTAAGAESWSYELNFGMGTRIESTQFGLNRVENDLRSHGVFSYLTIQKSLAHTSNTEAIPLGQNLTLGATAEWSGETTSNILTLHRLEVTKTF